MRLEAQVLGTGAEGHVASVVVSTEKSRVLFNVGEGTQRLAGEHGLRLSRSLDAICLTRLTWHHIGGLQDLVARSKPRRGELKMKLVGPPNIAELMLMTQYYMWSERLVLDIQDLAPGFEPAHAATDLTVQPVLLLPSGTDGSRCVGRSVQLVLNFSALSARRTPPPVQATVCYVCRTADTPGTFDARKAAALGVKGAQCRLLVQGQTVVTPDGRTVSPDDIISPSTPGLEVWIVDCPSMEFVEPLTSHPRLLAVSTQPPACVIHMTPNAVLGLPDYVRWMGGFGPGTQHVVLNPDACPQRLIHIKAAQRQTHYHRIDPRIFPLPHHSDRPLQPLPDGLPPRCVHGDNLLKFYAVTQPRKGKQEQGMDAAELIAPLPVEPLDSLPTFAQSLTNYRALLDTTTAVSASASATLESVCPDLRTSMAEAVERGLCTIYATGKSFASQEWFNCRTCRMERGYGCCAVCAATCHAGHELLPRGNSEGFYCDCGSASGEAVPWGAKGEMDGRWHCRAMNGVPPATVIHQFFPQPAYQVLDALKADTDSELVFLGTAAASPSKLRNVSSIYLHLASGGVIMDAGEGTYNQLLQRYGRADIDRVIQGLRLCFISHMHGDHLIGLVSLLLHRTELDLLRLGDTANDADADDKIVLVAPLDVHRMLEAYNRSCPVPLVYDFVECRHVHYARGLCDATGLQEVPGGRALARTMEALGLARVETAEVIHACNSGARAHAIALTSRDVGWKFVYSGDTLQPCQELIELGMGATVLIHEASFAQDKAREARRKFHSTSEDAIEAGMKMGAARIVLTHFSHQYVRSLPPFAPNARAAWATDLMSVRLCDLRRLPLVVAPMSAFFADQERQRGAKPDDSDDDDEPDGDDNDAEP